MLRLNCALIGLLFCSVASAEEATEQHFYQVFDENGRPQTIFISDPEAKPSTGKKVVAPPASADQKQATGLPVLPTQESLPAVPPPESILATPAAKPSEEGAYLDSEVLESTNFNPELKKRFYVVTDGVGTRVEESDGQLTGMSEGAPSLFPQKELAGGVPLTSTLIELTDPVEIQQLLGKQSLCTPQKDTKKAGRLTKGHSASVRVDDKTRHFAGVGSTLLILGVDGKGLRRLTLTSYSVSDKNPSFLMPVIAFADSAGCIIRAHPGGYFERRHEATKTRQHKAEGSIIMLSSERYVLILLPEEPQADRAEVVTLNRSGEITVEYE